MIFAKIEHMDNLPLCCNDCDFQAVGGWCNMLPADKQMSPIVANPILVGRAMYKGIDGQMHTNASACGRRNHCPLKTTFEELYQEVSLKDENRSREGLEAHTGPDGQQ